MKKNRLVVDFVYDFKLIGLVSSAKAYKLCWAINNSIGLRLIKMPDYDIEDHHGRKRLFSCYEDRNGGHEIQLFKNRSFDQEHGYIIPELPHFDFIIKVMDGSQTFAGEELIKQLRKVPYIEYLAPILTENLKSKENFLS